MKFKRIFGFSQFVNEQEKNKSDKGGSPEAVSQGVGDLMKDAAKMFKDAGFGDFTGDGATGAGGPGGSSSGIYSGGNYQVPSEEDVKNNIELVNKAMDRHGITDKNMRAAIQGVIGKESGWTPVNEKPYNNTSNDRIRSIFGKRMSGLSDSEINALKADEGKFWDRVYGPDDPTGRSQAQGNDQKGDGSKYKGRGFNGITFKENYKRFQDLYNKEGKLQKSVNIVSNPEQLNDPEVAAEFAVLYFVEELKNPKVKQLYGSNDPNGFSDLDTALKAVFHVNAGLGSSLTTPLAQETFAKSSSFAKDMMSKNMV